jgi:uncharacterized coiled-coil protein SlyX
MAETLDERVADLEAKVVVMEQSLEKLEDYVTSQAIERAAQERLEHPDEVPLGELPETHEVPHVETPAPSA